jgi:hypothetical protein
MTALTESTPKEGTAGEGTAATPTVSRSRRIRFWAVLAVLTVLLIVLLALAAAPGGRALDPTAATPNGSRAVATLLADHGVPVARLNAVPVALSTGPSAPTIVIVGPDELTADQRGRLAGYPGDVVLIGASDPRILAGLGEPLGAESSVGIRTRAPNCALPAAIRAGSATSGGMSYQPLKESDESGTVFCYPDASGGSGLVVLTRPGGGRLILFGTGAPLTNERLAQLGNAALTLSLLSGGPSVLWVMPPLVPTAGTEHSVGALLDRLPQGIQWGTNQLIIAVVLLAIASARRLGPPVTEDLPVSVRSAETTAGRARLYRAARARGTAANTLRDATRRRLAGRLRLLVGPAGPDPQTICRAVADHTHRSVAEIERLLYGVDLPGSELAGPPALDDAKLLDLDDQLNELERQVRAS